MTELIFICTTAFFTYIIFSITNNESAKSTPVKPQIMTPPVQPKPLEPPVSPITIQPIKTDPLDTTKTASIAIEPLTGKHSIRNPKTGEIATVTGNYRFIKRWIKEALVEEGLVEKIYGSNELTNELEKNIKCALARLVSMEMYKV